MLTKFLSVYESGEGFIFSSDKVQNLKRILPKNYEYVEVRTSKGKQHAFMDNRFGNSLVHPLEDGDTIIVSRDILGNIYHLQVMKGHRCLVDAKDYPELKEGIDANTTDSNVVACEDWL